ncbi:hypothetical protein KY284_001535 [Solanum tuberosum]|nr:hypothetical protein KY284_001535 [Solanum tuberosum]
MEVDPLDVEMKVQMENQHEHENINTIETSDEWTTWTDELAQLKCLVPQLQHLTPRKRARKSTPSSRRIDSNAQGPEDAAEEIERTEAQEITNDTFVGFPIVVVDVDDAPGTRENQAAQEEPNVSTESTQSPFTARDEPNESTRATQSSFTTQKGETHHSQKQGFDNYTPWSRAMKFALLGKNKLGFIDGSIQRDQFAGDLA